jgi:hypothetical protein
MKTDKPHFRSWYCSRIFWSGCIATFIIIWSWSDSFQHVRSFHTPDRLEQGSSNISYYSFHSRVGMLGITYETIDYSQRKNSSLPSRGFSSQSIPLDSPGWANLRSKNTSFFQLPIAIYSKTDIEIKTDYYYIAHWFLLIICWAILTILYFYRRSRIRHLHQQSNQHDETQ